MCRQRADGAGSVHRIGRADDRRADRDQRHRDHRRDRGYRPAGGPGRRVLNAGGLGQGVATGASSWMLRDSPAGMTTSSRTTDRIGEHLDPIRAGRQRDGVATHHAAGHERVVLVIDLERRAQGGRDARRQVARRPGRRTPARCRPPPIAASWALRSASSMAKPTMLTRTSRPWATRSRMACSGSPLQLSWPSVTSTMILGPAEAPRSPATSARVAAERCLVPLAILSPEMSAVMRAWSRGARGASSLLPQRRAGSKMRRRHRQPWGQGLADEVPQHLLRDVDASLLADLPLHAAGCVQQDLHADARPSHDRLVAVRAGRRCDRETAGGMRDERGAVADGVRGGPPEPRRQTVERPVDLAMGDGVFVVAAPAVRPVLHQVRGQLRGTTTPDMHGEHDRVDGLELGPQLTDAVVGHRLCVRDDQDRARARAVLELLHRRQERRLGGARSARAEDRPSRRSRSARRCR